MEAKKRQRTDTELKELVSLVLNGEVFTSEGLYGEEFHLHFPLFLMPDSRLMNLLVKDKPVMFFEYTEKSHVRINGRPRFWSAYFLGEEDYLRYVQLKKIADQ